MKADRIPESPCCLLVRNDHPEFAYSMGGAGFLALHGGWGFFITAKHVVQRYPAERTLEILKVYASDKEYEQAMADLVFDPLGLSSPLIDDPTEHLPTRARFSQEIGAGAWLATVRV